MELLAFVLRYGYLNFSAEQRRFINAAMKAVMRRCNKLNCIFLDLLEEYEDYEEIRGDLSLYDRIILFGVDDKDQLENRIQLKILEKHYKCAITIVLGWLIE